MAPQLSLAPHPCSCSAGAPSLCPRQQQRPRSASLGQLAHRQWHHHHISVPQPPASHACFIRHHKGTALAATPPAGEAAATAPATAAVAAAQGPASAGSGHAGDDGSKNDWRALILDKALQPGQLVRLTLKGRVRGDAAYLANVRSPPPTLAAAAAAAAAAATAGSSDNGEDAGGSDRAGSSSSSGSSSSDGAGGGSMPYRQLVLRPVVLKGKQMLQLSLFTAKQDITKNYNQEQAATQLAQLLQLPWLSAVLVTPHHTTTVQLSRKGKARVHTTATSSSSSSTPPGEQQQQPSLLLEPGSRQQQQQQLAQAPLITLQHDRIKAQPINGSVPDLFLQKIGLQTADGERIKAHMQAKFTQINEFLKLLVHTGELDRLGAPASSSTSSSSSDGSRAVCVLDAGCGSSHLTFGTYHYLHHVLGLPVQLVGVDTNRALMERSNKACADLGLAECARFHTAAILDFPGLGLPRPDIILALHACDTATDEALAVGVGSGAAIIMSVPCCQKDIHQQFQQQQQQQQRPSSSKATDSSGGGGGGGQAEQVLSLFEPLLGHGILRQRQLDLLTDTYRAQLLRLAGYRTDVVEFVSTEHTPRNLLIRAVKQRRPPAAGELARLSQQYVALRDAWGVRPRLEQLLLQEGLLPKHVAQLLS